jgi:hypothetical protein
MNLNLREPFYIPYGKDVSASEFETELPKLFSCAKRDVFMSTGLTSEFYDKEKIRESITSARNRGVEFKIIVDNGAKDPALWLLKEAAVPGSKIALKKSKIKIRHVIVADGKHVRIEEDHYTEEKAKSNMICYDMPLLAKVIRDDLQEIWDDKNCTESLKPNAGA